MEPVREVEEERDGDDDEERDFHADALEVLDHDVADDVSRRLGRVDCIFERLEDAIDATERVAHILEGITIKNT